MPSARSKAGAPSLSVTIGSQSGTGDLCHMGCAAYLYHGAPPNLLLAWFQRPFSYCRSREAHPNVFETASAEKERSMRGEVICGRVRHAGRVHLILAALVLAGCGQSSTQKEVTEQVAADAESTDRAAAGNRAADDARERGSEAARADLSRAAAEEDRRLAEQRTGSRPADEAPRSR